MCLIIDKRESALTGFIRFYLTVESKCHRESATGGRGNPSEGEYPNHSEVTSGTAYPCKDGLDSIWSLPRTLIQGWDGQSDRLGGDSSPGKIRVRMTE